MLIRCRLSSVRTLCWVDEKEEVVVEVKEGAAVSSRDENRRSRGKLF